MRDLATRFRDQAESCRAYESPLTAALLTGAADDMEAGGVTADLMAPHASDPGGTVPSLRFAGSLHRLVLQGRVPDLAAHYPSVGGTADVEQVWPAAEAVVRAHLEELRELVTHTVQTNEVGRSAALYGGLLLLGGKVRLLEVGASAGLNLSCDRYAYEVGAEVLGDAGSELRLEQPWKGDIPAYRGVEVVERLGCDLHPLDATTAAGRLTLASFVWGDQVERHSRLAAACVVASRAPVTVEREHGIDFVDRELRPRSGVTTVVWHSVVWQYVDPAERAAMDALIEERGATATEAAPVALLAMEPAKVGGGSYEFLLHLTRWPEGERRKVADAHGHGPPVVWG